MVLISLIRATFTAHLIHPDFSTLVLYAKEYKFEVLYSVFFSVLLSLVSCLVRINFAIFLSKFKELDIDTRKSKEKNYFCKNVLPLKLHCTAVCGNN